jgi:hypothetical protein
MKHHLRSRVRSRKATLPGAAMTTGLILALLLAAVAARAQTLYPRVGVSASPTEYIDTLEVVPGEEFTLYACVFGPAPGEPVGQAFTSLSWVIHQVCCGAEVDIHHFEYNIDLEHTGHPLLGVTSSSEDCYDQDSIVLATMTCRLNNPTPGGTLWAAGPFDASHDCAGGNALFVGMAVTLVVDEGSVPAEDTPWGSIKALYR